MNMKLINYLESKGIDIYFDGDSYEKYDLEKYQIGRGYEPKFIELMNTNPMSYNTHMFNTKDIKEILLYEDEIVVGVETKASKYDRRFVRFDFDIEPLLKEVKED